MRYLHYDLGEQPVGTCVVANLRGSPANVILLDPQNFDRYRLGENFLYIGGNYTRTPARIQIPQDGHWYLVIDCGGYRHDVRVANIEIVTPDESPKTPDVDMALFGRTGA